MGNMALLGWYYRTGVGYTLSPEFFFWILLSANVHFSTFYLEHVQIVYSSKKTVWLMTMQYTYEVYSRKIPGSSNCNNDGDKK